MILAGLMVILPGICYWVWAGSPEKDPLIILAKIIGTSISFHAIFLLIFFLLNLKINQTIIISIELAQIGLIFTGIARKHKLSFNWRWLGSIIAFAGLIFWRFWQAQNLILPAWVDSLHHTLIVKVIIEQGGLPDNLQPYLPGPFYYHYAFHAFTAHFTILSGLSPARAVLIFGQILNASIGLSVYALSKTLLKDWRLAAFAGLLTSFATMMPAYYLSWGRYTLLTGVLLLPLAMSEGVQLSSQKKHRLPDYIPFIILTAGTLLAHYFAAMLLAFFLVILASWQLLLSKANFSETIPRLIKLSLAAGFALLISSPWLLRVAGNTNMTVTPNVSIPSSLQAYFTYPEKWDYVKQLLGPDSGLILIPMALIAIILSLWDPNKRAFATWSLALMLMALPWGLQLGSFRSDHFVIVLFLPISILSAALLGSLSLKITRLLNKKWLEHLIIATLCLSICAWGGYLTKDVINKDTVFVDQADYTALIWVDENLPADARFFINTTPWGFGLYRGVDGGAWIMPFTGRWSLAPTIFYPFGRDIPYTNQIKDWNQRASSIKDCTPEFWELVEEANLTHVYLNAERGNLKAQTLNTCPGFRKVYANEEVSIWEIGN